MLFVDMWDYYRRQMYANPDCPPVLGHTDFGLLPRDLQALERAGLLDRIDALIDGNVGASSTGDSLDPLEQTLAGVELWSHGCRKTPDCDATCRGELLEQAEKKLPRAKLPPMCRVLALAEAGRWTAADELFISIYPDWRDDPRFPSIAAVLGLARGRFDEAEYELAVVPEEIDSGRHQPALRQLWSGQLDRSLVDRLKRTFPERWSAHLASALAAEHRFYVMLWQRRHDEAMRYAGRMTERMRAFDLSPGRWIERQADAAFHAGDFDEALTRYREALPFRDHPASVLLKLSDVHFKLGNLDQERAYRQKIYGTLEPKWTRRDPEPGLGLDAGQLCPGTD
jgi:tetratricopeptide (TPR) repeat protein